MKHRLVLAIVLLGCCIWSAPAAGAKLYERQEDVIYGRKYGMALTMDVLRPKENANGRGVVFVVSGGWVSTHDFGGMIPVFNPLFERGYTVFAVVHGSQPKFTIPEAVEDLHRAIRFIRFHAEEYGIDPDRIGIVGASAGGHLSLMMGTAGTEGNPGARDPVDRVSSRVQAVACLFPPTDFLNYGEPGNVVLGDKVLSGFAAPFDFHQYDAAQKKFVPVTDNRCILEIGRAISPIYHVTADSAPTLIVHGDKDTLVPIQQSETMVEKLKEAGVEAKLVVKPGAGHGWLNLQPEMVQFADWLDEHLK